MSSLIVIAPEDKRVLGLLAPLMATITAATILATTYAKALFLGHNPFAALPAMYIAAALFTAFATWIYVQLVERLPLGRRFQALLWLTVASWILLGVVAPGDPVAWSLVAFTWVAGVGQVLVIQMWSFSTAVLPVRQARRIFPLLAAAATLGAAAGGGLAAFLPAPALLHTAAGLLVVTSWLVGTASDRLADPAHPKRSPARDSGLARALNDMRRQPLLLRLGAFLLLLQVASVLMDFQLSAAVKTRWDTGGIAAFLGGFYGISNLATLGLALFGGQRLAARFGLAKAVSSPAMVLVVGSALGTAASILGIGALFWGVSLTAFGERVVTFGLGRQSVAAALTPIDIRAAERARFVIDGIGVRLVTAAVGSALLFVGPDLADFPALSPLIFASALLALAFGARLGRAYRQALVDALGRRDVGPVDAAAVRAWAERDARRGVEELLAGGDATSILTGLDRCEALGLRLDRATVDRVLGHPDPHVVARAAHTLAAVDQVATPRQIEGLLDPSRPAEVLRAGLDLLQRAPSARPYDAQLATLSNHQDPLVACLSQLRRVSPRATMSTARITGHLRDHLLSLPQQLADPDPAVRREAADALAAVRSRALVTPLLNFLESPSIAPAATATLVRFGAEAVVPTLRARMEVPTATATRLRQLQLAERLGATAVLTARLRDGDAVVRDFAIGALWRLARDPERERPDPEELRRVATAEIDALERLADADPQLTDAATPAVELLRREVALQRAHGEDRTFRLLGLMGERDAVERAFQNVRSRDTRERSNAIELLDASLEEVELRRFVAYVERTEHVRGRSFTRGDAAGNGAASADAVAALLRGVDPVLDRVLGWADGAGDEEARTMDRVLMLSSIPLFSDMPAEELLAIADICTSESRRAGETIFRPGDAAQQLYLIERGEVEILREDRPVARFGEREAFGELAILGHAKRNTTARAVSDVDFLVLAREDFEGLLDISPSLAKRTIAVLTQRLRETLERLG